jgi:isocitrate/isopropylmalate dehydrogenase
MEKNIAVIKGDGIGPEIVTESMKVLDKVASSVTSSTTHSFLWADARLTQTAYR